jgi:hypothetical protein
MWLVRAVAFDHVVCAVPAHGAFLYKRVERLRRTSPLPPSVPPSQLTNHPPSLPPPQFANVHDVSWGTKGDNKVQTDLGKVEVKQENNNEVDVSMPVTQEQLNVCYEDAIHVLKTKPPKVESTPDVGTVQEDYYRGFRTKWVVVFFFFGRGLVLIFFFLVFFV